MSVISVQAVKTRYQPGAGFVSLWGRERNPSVGRGTKIIKAFRLLQRLRMVSLVRCFKSSETVLPFPRHRSAYPDAKAPSTVLRA
jgi:hypothetical protein